MDDNELDDRLQRVITGLASETRDPPSFPRGTTPHQAAERPGRGRVVLLAVAALLVGIIGWITWEIASDQQLDTARPEVTVLHEVVVYEQSFDLDCPGGVEVDGSFDSMVFESWGSQELGRWRQVVTYPDGSQRELLAEASPWYPSALYIAGEPQGQSIVCSRDVLLAEPGQGSWFGLNPMATVPTIPGSTEPAVQSYEDLGELVDEDTTGPAGQPVELWQQVIEGSYTNNSGDNLRLTQVQEWLIDPSTDQIVARRFSQDYEGIGRIEWNAELTVFEQTTVTPETLDVDGLNPQPIEPVPGLTPGG